MFFYIFNDTFFFIHNLYTVTNCKSCKNYEEFLSNTNNLYPTIWFQINISI